MRSLIKFQIGLFCLPIWVASPSAQASSIVQKSLHELVQAADLIVHGVVSKRETARKDDSIRTFCTLRVQRALKGGVNSGDKVRVILHSGQQGDLGVQIMGEPSCPSSGTEVVLFAYGDRNFARIVGVSQGWLEVRDGRVKVQAHELGAVSFGRPHAMLLQNGSAIGEFLDRVQHLSHRKKTAR